jgi:hypothetical protein
LADVEALLGLLLAAAEGRAPHVVLLLLLLFTGLLLAGALLLATGACRTRYTEAEHIRTCNRTASCEQ